MHIRHRQFAASASAHNIPFLSQMKGLLFFTTFLFTALSMQAQAPTSLWYPANTAYITNVSNAYLAPTLSGSRSGISFTISPALPAGLSFNTGTGVISGTPTAASLATTYTVTATNGSGSTSTTFVVTVSTSFFNNANNQVSFPAANRTFKVGDGTAVGDIALYANVAIISGQALDCIVKTIGKNNVNLWYSYDQPNATDNATYNSNDDKFFSPQLDFAAAGNVTFDFQYIISGSYNATTKSGTTVTLQNVSLNSYDIDGNGSANSNQYNEFDGFTDSELDDVTTLSPPLHDATTNLARFISGTATNNTNVIADATRVRLKYSNMSHFRIQMGAGASGRAYFFFNFSAGPAFTTTNVVTAPSIDLNTTIPGTGNAAAGCATALAFSQSGQTNVAAGTALNEFRISYDNSASHIVDGASETLVISGATAGTGTHALNFSSGSTGSVTVGGVAYNITKSVSGSTNTISFTTAGTFTVADAEALLDALQYSNGASNPTPGDRNFTVNVLNTQYMSPDAVFTATVNCVSISGNLYHDANGLTDNTVNATGSTMGQFAAGAAYMVLTDATTNSVLSVKAISAGGAYSFGTQMPGAYNLFISNTATPGATMTASTYPAGNYQSVGENLGAAAGNDGQVDGKMTLTLGTTSITNANFGIQLPPVAAAVNASNQPNPGGFNYYTLPAADFAGTDADGTVQTITISSFPSGANYLKIGSTIYTNGGTCPPQSSCTAWPGSVTFPFASAGTVSVDPSSSGNTSVIIDYYVTDNGSLNSNGSTITIPFVVPATPISISGTVWADANNNGVKEAGEGYSAIASAGQTLYAMLIQTTNTYSGAATILTSTPVSAITGYSFNNIPGGNNYEVRIASLTSAPADGVAKSTIGATLAANYTGVSTNNNGTIAATQNTNDLVNSLGVVSADKIAVGFGLNGLPNTSPFSSNIPTPSANTLLTLSSASAVPVLSGNDPEDLSTTGVLTGRKVAITTLPANGQLWYNGVQITKGADNTTVPSLSNPFLVSSFDPAKLQVKFTGSGYMAISFSYAFVDAAGFMDQTPALYQLNWSVTLPIKLVSFTAKKEGAAAVISWKTANETNMQAYVVERSSDGNRFAAVATVPARGDAFNTYSYGDASLIMAGTKGYYRLKMVNKDGSFLYSEVLSVNLDTNDLTVTVSPNPVRAVIGLRIDLATSGNVAIRITDVAGRTLYAKTVSLTAGSNVVRIETTGLLSNGVYLVQTEAAGHIQTQRIMVQH